MISENLKITDPRDNVGRITEEDKTNVQGVWGSAYTLTQTYDNNGNMTQLQDTSSGKTHNFTFNDINLLTNISEGNNATVFNYNTIGLLTSRVFTPGVGPQETTSFAYNNYKVLDLITTPSAAALKFNIDLLGNLRNYETSSRDSGFDFDSVKQLGEFDQDDNEWKRYHWCKNYLLGYEDDDNTYYIVTDIYGSTVVIFNSNSVQNRIIYDNLGKIRSQTTTPQVGLLYRGDFMLTGIDDMYYDARRKRIKDVSIKRGFRVASRIERGNMRWPKEEPMRQCDEPSWEDLLPPHWEKDTTGRNEVEEQDTSGRLVDEEVDYDTTGRVGSIIKRIRDTDFLSEEPDSTLFPEIDWEDFFDPDNYYDQLKDSSDTTGGG